MWKQVEIHEKRVSSTIPRLVHPTYFLQIEKTHFSEYQHPKQYLSIAVSFFHCYNIRSTRIISVPASELAIVYKRKHFSYQLHSQMAILLNAWQYYCISRSCDYSVNVCHVQPPLTCYQWSGHTHTCTYITQISGHLNIIYWTSQGLACTIHSRAHAPPICTWTSNKK